MSTQQQAIDRLAADLVAAKGVGDKVLAALGTIKVGIDSMKDAQAALQKALDDLKAQNPTLDLSAATEAGNALATELTTLGTAADVDVADLPAPPLPPNPTGGQ